MPGGEVGHMEDARLLGGLPLHRIDRPIFPQMARQNRQPVGSIGTLGHGAEPVGLSSTISQGGRTNW